MFITDNNSHFVPQPLVILARRIKKQKNKFVTEVLVQWTETNPKDVVWRNLYEMQHKFSNFKLGVKPCGQVLVNGGNICYITILKHS